MKQYIVGKTYGSLGTQADYPRYTALRGNAWQQGGYTNEAFQYSHPWSVDGAFTHLYVEIEHIPENPSQNGWPDITFTIYVNDVATDLTVTVPTAPSGGDATVRIYRSAQNTTDTAPIQAGDRVALGRGAGTIAPGINQFTVWVAWSVTFEATNDGESGYAVSSYGTGVLGAGSVLSTAVMNGAGGFTTGTDTVNAPFLHSIVPLEGSIFRLDAQIDIAPGTGKTRTFLMRKNGVLQDGTGGTVDTQCTIANAGLSTFSEFELPVDVLDWVQVVQLVSTTPANAILTCSIGLRATTDGQSALNFDTIAANPLNTDGDVDYAGGRDGAWAGSTAAAPTPTTMPLRWPVSEESMSLPGPLQAFTLSGLCINLGGSGAGDSYALTTRNAFADTDSVNTISGSDVLTVGTGEANFRATTDRLDLQSLALDSPNAVTIGWTWLVTETVAPPIVSTSYPIRRLRRFALPFAQNKWIRISRVELILQAGVGLSNPADQGYDPIVMFRLSRDGGMTWDSELQMSMGKIGEYERRAFLNMLGRARNPVVELTSSDPVFVSWISFTVDYEEGTS